MGTPTTPGAVTITPIYWVPSGYGFSSDPTYQTIVNQYLTDLAATATTPYTNAVTTTAEYTNTTNVKMTYSITAGAAITDTNPFTSSSSTGCTSAATITAPYTTCVSDAQMRAELKSLISAKSLPTDLANIYAVFFPPNVLVQGSDGSVSCVDYVGYHSAIASTVVNGKIVNPIIYMNEPYGSTAKPCNRTGQQPNNDVAADAQIDVLSHEISETLTDPETFTGFRGWVDSPSGSENGDECGSFYGPPVGYTSGSAPTLTNPTSTGYNQVINGHYYYTQAEFSNASYKANGVGKGCLFTAYVPPAAAAAVPASRAPARAAQATTTGPSLITLDASPASLPADGASTSTVTVTALDANGEPVAGDRVYVRVMQDVATLGGACGTLSPADSTGTAASGDVVDFTDANGQVVVTYTASTTNADCRVQATDTEGGTTNQTLLYQGTDRSTAPSVSQTLPSQLTAGGPAVTFTASATNPTSTDIRDAQYDVFITGDNSGATGLDAGQLTLSYADAATGGQFVNVPMSGTTANDGEIDGFAIPDTVHAIPAGTTETVTFKVSLAPGASATAQTGAPLRIETDLDQVSPADGMLDNLDYASGDVPVVLPACSSLVAVPALNPVPQGFAQALAFATTPGATLNVTLATNAAYPATALLLTDSNRFPQTLNGTAVPNGYRYTFTAGTHFGLAALAFLIPRNAALGTVQVNTANSATCSTPTTFQVVSGFASAQPQGLGAITTQDGITALRFVMPQGYTPPAAALMGAGRVRIMTAGHGADARTVLIFTYQRE